MSQDISYYRLAKPVDDRDHSSGPVSAVITLVEYGDYQSKECLKANQIIEDLLKISGNWLRYVFRQNPQEDKNSKSLTAAFASEAAAKQGMFWEMHDYLLDNQNSLSEQSIIDHAENLGMDVDEFVEDFNSEEVMNNVNEDIESARMGGVDSSPAFFINGMKYNGPMDFQSVLIKMKEIAEDYNEE